MSSYVSGDSCVAGKSFALFLRSGGEAEIVATLQGMYPGICMLCILRSPWPSCRSPCSGIYIGPVDRTDFRPF